MFRDGFGYSVEHALKVIQLSCQLHFDDDYLAFAVAGFYIDTVELVCFGFLIAFAFEYLADGYFLAEQDGDQSFEYGEVRLVSEHAFHRPIESYVFIVDFHNTFLFDDKGKTNV